MSTITFILPDGQRQIIDAEPGNSIMQMAVSHGIAGIDGACGGFCSCATCHVFVESGQDYLPAMGPDEDAMLAGTAVPRTKRSRLACQLRVAGGSGPVVVRIAGRQ